GSARCASSQPRMFRIGEIAIAPFDLARRFALASGEALEQRAPADMKLGDHRFAVAAFGDDLLDAADAFAVRVDDAAAEEQFDGHFSHQNGILLMKCLRSHFSQASCGDPSSSTSTSTSIPTSSTFSQAMR